MHAAFWTLQIILAIHTLTGAFWKFSNSVDAVPSLRAIPDRAWRVLGVIEIVLALILIVPVFNESLAKLAAFGALGITLEMLVFSAIHLRSGSKTHGQMIYWLVVAALAAFVAITRLTA